MCGIAGIAKLRGYLDNDNRIDAMCGTLRHRGPDDYGHVRYPSIHLGMRRLAIIDISGGQQPLWNEDQTVCVVFNGEIYNFAELRTDLIRRGHVIKSVTDGAVLPHLYEEYGIDFLRKLNGMFAIALHDLKAHTLHLARDRYGIKPLYYAQHNDEIAFGSEVKAILALGEYTRRLNPNALGEFLAWEYVPSPWTMFEDIRKLEPGSLVTATLGARQLSVSRWWTSEMTIEAAMNGPCPTSEGDWVDAVNAALCGAVQRQLVSDVPLGALLSGGVDSSLVASAMPGAVAFTADLADNDYSELFWSQRVANHLGLQHIWEMVHPSLGLTLDKLIYHLDDPIGDFSVIPTLLVSQLSSRSATVVLSGDGGDELFGGYEAYIAQSIARRCDRLPAIFWPMVQRALVFGANDLRKSSLRHRLLRLLQGMQGPRELGHTRWRLRLSDHDRVGLFNPDFGAMVTRPVGAHVNEKSRVFAELPYLSRQLCIDMETYLPDNCLAKLDRMSMACSVEARVPFLDNELVHLALRMPDNLKLRGLQGKYLLKKVAARHVPKDCVYRAKRGFTVPMGEWLRAELRTVAEDFLSSSRLRVQGIFNPVAIEQLKFEHFAGTHDHAHVLWSLLVFELWTDRWMAANQHG